MHAVYLTNSPIPLEAFQLMGVNAKTSANAIGRFGTGLKYAVAVILRHAGTFQLFVDDVEYEFYLSNKVFRDKTFQQVRMRKRYGLGKWLSSKALPFTTEYGRDWDLWQAMRELESNTRDEQGITEYVPDLQSAHNIRQAHHRTMIVIGGRDFKALGLTQAVFLEITPEDAVVYSDDTLTIYDKPSKHLYYQGIRVYDLRYPARLTYAFKAPAVRLTEDRSAANVYDLMNRLAMVIMSKELSPDVLKRILKKTDNYGREELTFENRDLYFDSTQEASKPFQSSMRSLHGSGGLGYSGRTYHSARTSFITSLNKNAISMTAGDWLVIGGILKDLTPKLFPQETEIVQKLIAAIDNQKTTESPLDVSF